METKLVIFVLFIAAAQASIAPARSEPVKAASPTKVFTLNGASGTFTYPTSGSTYGYNERILFQLRIEQQSVFTVENYDIETYYDELFLFNSENSALSKEVLIEGTSNTPIYYLVNTDVFGVFSSDNAINKKGFTLSWGPINTVTQQ